MEAWKRIHQLQGGAVCCLKVFFWQIEDNNLESVKEDNLESVGWEEENNLQWRESYLEGEGVNLEQRQPDNWEIEK